MNLLQNNYSRATIKDVARLAGVSIVTVSRVSNGKPNVHEDTRRKVQAAIKELDYTPSVFARQLRSMRKAPGSDTPLQLATSHGEIVNTADREIDWW